MKKLIALFLTVSLLISIVACGNKNEITTDTTLSTEATVETTASTDATTQTEETTQTTVATEPSIVPETNADAAALISDAIDALDDMKTLVSTQFLSMKMGSSALNYYQNYSSETVLNEASENSFSISSTMISSDDEGSSESTRKLYCDGEYYYVTEYGASVAYAVNDETKEEFGSTKIIVEIPEKSITSIKEENDVIVITAELDEATASEAFSEFLPSITEIISEITEETPTFVRASVTVKINKDGYIVSYEPEFAFSFSTKYDSVTIPFEFELNCCINIEHGKEVSVEIPENHKDFPVITLEEFPYYLANSAIEKTLVLDNVDVQNDKYISMQLMGVTSEIEQFTALTAARLGTDGVTLRQQSLLSYLGSDYEIDVYYENGYYYISQDGETMKLSESDMEATDSTMAMSKYTLKELVGTSVLTVPNLKAETTDVSDFEDGTTEVYFYIDETTFGIEFSGHIYDTIEYLFGEEPVEDLTLYYPEIYVYVTSDGYIDCYDISYYVEFTTKVNGTKVSVLVLVYDTTYFTNPGADVTVTPPDGYQYYPSLSTKA